MVLDNGLIPAMALEGTGQRADTTHGTGERAGPPQCPVVIYLAVLIGANFQIIFIFYLE
jgi:hypothetical protein